MHNLRRMLVLVALALLIAPLVVNAPLFDPDEGLHAAIAQEMVQRGDYVTPTFLGQPFLDKPILFFWAEALSLRLFGDREFAVRLPPLLFGLAGMLSVSLLGGALFGQASGLIAGIAYGTMLLPLGVSQVAVHDIGLIPFMCVACWCLVRVAAGGHVVRLGILAGLLLGLSILTKGLVGCVFAAIFAACLAARQREVLPRVFFALAIAGIISVLVAVPWYLAMEQAHPGYLHYYFIERHLEGYLTATQRHAGRPWWYYLPIVAGGALPWTAYLGVELNQWRQHSTRIMVWAWFLVGLLFLSMGESKLVTYALPVFPALALLVGDTVARRTLATLRTPFVLHAFFLIAIVAAGLFGLEWRYEAAPGWLWAVSGTVVVQVIASAWTAWRSPAEYPLPMWASGATIASLVVMMLVMRQAAAWMTARDLAMAFNAHGSLPSRVSVVDERIGSLVFYLAPPLRAQATAERLVEASFSEALARARMDQDDAIIAVRHRQIERFKQLSPALPEADEHAGTFAIFRAGTLKRALGP